MARRPGLIKRMFITKEYSKYGIYRLKLYRLGEWINVTVDDFFPCYYNGQPMFTRGQPDEIWVMLLEKAYAKLLGSYDALKQGSASKVFFDFIGMPTFKIHTESGI